MLDALEPSKPSAEDFSLESAAREQSAQPAIRDFSWETRNPPKPGLGLAIVIMLAIPLLQVVSSWVYITFVEPDLLAHVASGDLFDHLKPGQLGKLLAFNQVVFVSAAFLGTWCVLGHRFSRAIPLSLPRMRHVTIIALLVLPLAVMDIYLIQQLIAYAESVWGVTPSQGELPALLDGLTAGTSFWTLLLILAVAPALGEELVFRGVIGRGLVARKGIVFGVIWTSLLFSVVHGNPAQAVGVFFVGVMCHVAYLATRSLWAPVFLHFLNNSLVVVALKSQEGLAEAAAEHSAVGPSPWLALAAAVCVAMLGSLLWKSRIEDRDELDEPLPGEYPAIDQPEDPMRPECRPVAPIWIGLAGLSYLLFLASVSLQAGS